MAHSDGCNGRIVIFHRESSRGGEIETRCEGESGQVCLAVEAFTLAGCMFYFPADFLGLLVVAQPDKSQENQQ